ncbi:MAG: AAA family ATPase [Candidatus Woesearchaeota archaeon]
MKMKSKLFGFDEVIEELSYRVQAGSMVFVEGRRGSGKTALLKAIIDRFRGKKRVIYIDCNTIKDLDIEAVMQRRYGLIGRLMGITPKNMVLLADNVQHLSRRNVQRLQYFFDHNYIYSVIFTGESYAKSKLTKSLRDRIGGRVMRVPVLSPGDAIEIAHERFSLEDEAIVKKIYKHSKGVADFIDNCIKVGEFAEKNNIARLKEEDVKTALGK